MTEKWTKQIQYYFYNYVQNARKLLYGLRLATPDDYGLIGTAQPLVSRVEKVSEFVIY